MNKALVQTTEHLAYSFLSMYATIKIDNVEKQAQEYCCTCFVFNKLS